ncbi:MAG: hypothetical protein QXQ50_03915 [Candidatus Bathyarchaeia archaeon]
MGAEKKVLLGFEVGTGQPVYMPIHHLAVFGITQLSGKTTALEAIITRSGLRAVAFITKRGESGFTKFRLIPPFYRVRVDWQFVEGLVNVALGEKVKYEPGMRWAIIRVSRGAKNLREVKDKAEEMLAEARRDFHRQVFEKLVTYLDAVVPELERWQFSSSLELADGVNVMDLSAMQPETQQIIIASTIEYIFQNMDHVVVVIPEAWETLPEHKMTPVKWIVERFIRKGAAVGNYVFLDSQDIGGISKVPLRQCDNWLLGRMREAHEVERILKQLLGRKVPYEEIQTLPLGHFYAVFRNEVRKVYVLPAGVPEEVGRDVALGKLTPEYVRDNFLAASGGIAANESSLDEKLRFLRGEIGKLQHEKAKLEAELKALEPLKALKEALTRIFQEAQWQEAQMASNVIVRHHTPFLTVRIERKPLILSTKNTLGRLALLYAEAYFDEKERTISEIQKELVSRGWPKDPRLSAFLDELCSWGYLRKRRTDRWLYFSAIKSVDAKSKGLLKEVEVVECKAHVGVKRE